MSDDAIDARLASGRWRRLTVGVLATFSGPLSRAARLWAAVLATGPATMLSHYTAAELWGIAPEAAEIHVCVPANRRVTAPAGVVVHRSRNFARACHPALSPPRTRVEDTVLDLAECSADLDSALAWPIRAVTARLTTTDRLLAATDTRSRLRWRRELRDALRDVTAGCHSVLELRYVRCVERAHGLPYGIRQRRRDRWRDDVSYLDYRVQVELDGRIAHPDELAFRDRRRDNAAVLGGARVLRYGHADVTHHPCGVAQEVAAVLRAEGWPGKLRGCGNDCLNDRGG
jgi:very-short-patch-repair endonuclease